MILSYVYIVSYSAVNISETPAVATVEKKEYVYETKEEAKQAFKELLREKVSTFIILYSIYMKVLKSCDVNLY